MRYIIRTANKECTIKMPITALSSAYVYVEIKDYANPNAVLIQRVDLYNAGDTTPMYLQLPITGEFILIEVFENEYNREQIPSGFTVGDISKMGITTRMNVVRGLNAHIDEWVELRAQFAFNANWLPLSSPGEIYKSRAGRFRIRYVDVIFDENGNEDVTPMQIHKDTAIITVSRKKITDLGLNIYELIAILDHEFSHKFMNKIEAWETESDINGIMISLCSGIPKMSVLQAYEKVLYFIDSDENLDRMHYVYDLVYNRFEELAS